MPLANRFPSEVFAEWQDWHTCLECGKNTNDCLHHIISPTNKHYIKGNHNKSILNSAPICNHKCHLYNSELQREYKVRELLDKTIRILFVRGYKLKKVDYDFLHHYKHLYG
jgi:hypothetical protein